MLRPVVLAAVLAGLPTALAACGGAQADGDGSVRVVATTAQAADFARAVGGRRAAVTGLLPANVDPHDFELRPDDVQALAEAELVVRSGGDVDRWLDDAVAASRTDADVLVLGDHVELLDDDPH